VSRFFLALSVAGVLTLAGPWTAAAADPVKVMLLPVVVHSLDQAEYLQTGVGDMLMSRLSQAGGLNVIRVTDLKSATTDLEAARSAARAVGARYVVFGSFTSFGEGASLDLLCARTDATDESARQIFVQSGALGSIIPRIDDLADRVVRYVAESSSGGGLPAVSAGPAAKAGVSRAEVDDLRRRVDALEEATRSHATTATGLPPPPKAPPGGGGPRTN
jgi:hypothetical protein